MNRWEMFRELRVTQCALVKKLIEVKSMYS